MPLTFSEFQVRSKVQENKGLGHSGVYPFPALSLTVPTHGLENQAVGLEPQEPHPNVSLWRMRAKIQMPEEFIASEK